ncbi:MAG: hypothetical protein LLG13_08550 [Bacteroidales bacterium]|nr:hypothetical protein [Bacteroidales bacterium]
MNLIKFIESFADGTLFRNKARCPQVYKSGVSQKILRPLFQESDTSVQFYETLNLHFSHSFAQNLQIPEDEKNNDYNYLNFVLSIANS